MVGSTLSNRYEITEKLGEGGMAVVYRARDRVLGRRVAIKVLRPQFAADTDFVERFRREAQAAASLSHPNVVNIFDVGTDGDVHYIVMEYVDGQNLKQILRSEGRLSVEKTVAIGEGVCRALQAAHREGLIHRDIKPHNILVTRDGQVKVTDFGIARAASTATLTQTGTVIGSVHYLSPEQAVGKPVGATSDIYSVGVLLYEMVTGKVPFDGDSPVAVALQHLQDDPASPRLAVPHVPEALERVILRAMAKAPEQRYASIDEMLNELQRIGREEATHFVSGVTVDEDSSPRSHDDDTDEASEDGRTRRMPAPVGRSAAEAVGISEDQPEDVSLETTRVHAPVRQEELPDVEEERQVPANKRKRRSLAVRLAMWLVIILSFSAGAVWAGLTFFDRLFPEDVSVPSIQGMTVEEARQVLQEHGLGLRIVREVNSDQRVGTIVRQVQEAGRTVKMGREIEVHVSIGQEIVDVPDLALHSEREASLRLVQAGLEVGEVTYEYRPDIAPNLVVSQTPEAHARVQRGSPVHLVFSTGAPPVPMVQMPDFRGRPLAEAVREIEELGLVLGETFPEEDPAFSPGQVTDQYPIPGTETEVGSAVNFVYYPQRVASGQADTSGVGPSVAQSESGDGDVQVQSIITIHVPPGPEQEVEIVIIDNISARRVYYGVHRGDARITQIIKGRGADAMYQVWIGGELHGQGLIAEAR